MDNLQERIARRAYELFQARGGVHGYHLQDWYQAEKEILGSIKTEASQSRPSATVNSSSADKPKGVTGARKRAVSRKK